MSEPISPKVMEPETLSASLAEFIHRHEPGTRMHGLATDLLRSHQVSQERRAAVLKHADLAKRLVTELDYQKPGQWNGYIPPSMWNAGDDALCRSAYTGRHGEVRFTFGQLGHRAMGEMPNDSPRREVLLDISREAWARARRAAVEGQNDAPEGPPDAT